MRFIRLCLTAFSITLAGQALAEDKAQIMLMGTFHFSNPGLDAIKTKQINVMTPENQQYLVEFTERLANSFKPTHIALECRKEAQQKLEADYQQYLQGNFKLPVNEDYQVGFRVGKFAQAKHLICIDEQEVHFQSEAVMKAMSKEEQASFGKVVQEYAVLTEKRHMTKPLAEVLKIANLKSEDTKNKSLYLHINSVGANNGYAGADSAVTWWHRNFRMYANIQKMAQPGTRVLAVMGQGHTSVIGDFIDMDAKREQVEILPLF